MVDKFSGQNTRRCQLLILSSAIRKGANEWPLSDSLFIATFPFAVGIYHSSSFAIPVALCGFPQSL
jgi:hypothetical protein